MEANQAGYSNNSGDLMIPSVAKTYRVVMVMLAVAFGLGHAVVHAEETSVASETAPGILGIPTASALAQDENTLGVWLDQTARSREIDGLEVIQVMPGSPATRLIKDGRTYTLVPFGDIVTHINGQPTPTVGAFQRAYKRAMRRKQIVLRVFDVQRQVLEEYRVPR